MNNHDVARRSGSSRARAGKRKMAALKEERSYALSCGRLSDGSGVSVHHVKLTDSALRAFEEYRSSEGLTAKPLIRFTGSQGKISVPQSENELRVFAFYLCNVGRDNPRGSFDCVQQYITSEGSIQLDCLGVIQDKITVCATDDSYQKARQSMTQTEEETRSRAAIVIKPGGKYMSKRVQIRKPVTGLSDPALSRRTTRPVLISSSRKKSPPRPLRERLVHLLALKPYRKAELLVRLLKDGLSPQDKQMLDGLLQQVADVSSKDCAFTLKDCVFKEVQRNWPGYTEVDQQILKRVLVRKLCKPQRNVPAPGESPVSPQKEPTNSSPTQKRPEVDFIDPLANKKSRISHLANKSSGLINGRLSSSNGKDSLSSEAGETSCSSQFVLDIPRPFEPLSDCSNDSNSRDCDSQEAALTERLSQPPALTSHSTTPAERPGSTSPTHSALQRSQNRSTLPSLHGKSKKKSKKHKDKDKSREREPADSELKREKKTEDEKLSSGLNGTCDSSRFSVSSADYLLKYTVISSQEQRQSYKNDFNEEYSEYRGLHSRIDSITRQFTVLDSELRQLQHGTHKYKTIHNQILQEYRKIKKKNPNYSQEKNRCEYLHNKLAHIKKLIAQYDQQQL